MSDQLGRPEETLHERSGTPGMSRRIVPRGMRVVKAGTKGGPHADFSSDRCIGDFGIPVFHRFGWCCRPKASSLNRVGDDGVCSGERVVE